jgi:predicted permease
LKNSILLKINSILPLILFSSNALAANEDKLDATTIIIIFIIAQVLSIVGIVSLGFKRKKKKKEDSEK